MKGIDKGMGWKNLWDAGAPWIWVPDTVAQRGPGCGLFSVCSPRYTESSGTHIHGAPAVCCGFLLLAVKFFVAGNCIQG